MDAAMHGAPSRFGATRNRMARSMCDPRSTLARTMARACRVSKLARIGETAADTASDKACRACETPYDDLAVYKQKSPRHTIASQGDHVSTGALVCGLLI